MDRRSAPAAHQRVRAVADEMLEAFRTGKVPKALATALIRRNLDIPAATWSWRNRLLIALRGHVDARGFPQWQAVGRKVRKGERAVYILAPRLATAKEDDPERDVEAGERILVGFRAVPVFGFDQTAGDPLPGTEAEAAWIEALPVLEVARSWGLSVVPSESSGDRLGFYRGHAKVIGLATPALLTWAHELLHAAEDRLGSLTRRPGQQVDNEVVAEFGGAVLLECLGYETESDRGGALAYLAAEAKQCGGSVFGLCSALIERTCACVASVLDEARELSETALAG